MSDESDDKTEAPTPHRLEKAREEGQIPRSRELTSLLILLVALVLSGLAVCRWPLDRACFFAAAAFDHSIINDPSGHPRADLC
ncbi:EscU/YscU/HrcU family type III secretion system export apparatus switch protein [Shigella flexneri]